jgi:hypothetical protein
VNAFRKTGSGSCAALPSGPVSPGGDVVPARSIALPDHRSLEGQDGLAAGQESLIPLNAGVAEIQWRSLAQEGFRFLERILPQRHDDYQPAHACQPTWGLARRFGLACDNVSTFEIVTPDGDTLRATATEHPDLWWGLRGGGGNFGVVTEFTFRLHQLDGRALIVACFQRLDEAPKVLGRWREFVSDAPAGPTPTARAGTTGSGRSSPPSSGTGRWRALATSGWEIRTTGGAWSRRSATS